MGFMVEGSTGARAVAVLKTMPPGTVVETPEFALMLQVNPGALHQLLANAVKLNLIRKVHTSSPCVGWTLGSGNDGVTIERRAPAPPAAAPGPPRAPRAPRAAAAPPPAAPTFTFDRSWPPRFESTFDSPRLDYQPPTLVDRVEVEETPAVVGWLTGLLPAAAPTPVGAPQPQQLSLFSAEEIGPPGRARRRQLRRLGIYQLSLITNQRVQPAARQDSMFEG